MVDQSESKFSFRAKSSHEAEEWFKAIKWTVDNSYGSEYHLNKILEIPHFETL
jgi:hypothetical protein